MIEKKNIIKGGYSVEIFGQDGKKFFWKAQDNHTAKDANDYNEIGLRVFDFNLFEKKEKCLGKKGSSDFTYLLILI